MSPTSFDQIPDDELHWLSWPRIPYGHITLLGARGGSGKGLVSASLAGSVTGPASIFGNCERLPQAQGVLWIEEEDPAGAVVKPRLRAAGADLSKVWFDRAAWFRRRRDVRLWLQEHDVGLVVFSPLLTALGIEKINDPQPVFNAMNAVQEMIEGLPIAALGIVHTNKSQDVAAIERILGSVTFVNFARSVLLISTRGGEKRLIHAKCNVGPKADDLLLTPYGEARSQAWAVRWSAPDNGNCDEEAAFDRGGGIGGGNLGKWLLTFLGDCGGMEKASVCLAAGAMAGYKDTSLQSVRKSAGIESAKAPGANGVWWWRLPSGPGWPWPHGV